MKHTTKSGAIAIAAVALAATLSQGVAASAHGAPFTVTAGTAAAGTSVPVTLTTTGTLPQFTYKDTTTGTVVSCNSVTLRGSVRTGSTGTRIGTIDSPVSVFSGCKGPAGLTFKITGYGAWTLDVADSTAGVSTISVGAVRAHLQTTAGPGCGWDFAAPTGSFTSTSTATTAPGSLATTYTNSSQSLALPASNPGSLGLWNVKAGTSGTNTFCISRSVWKQGDRMSWSATWKVTADTAAYNPVSIN